MGLNFFAIVQLNFYNLVVHTQLIVSNAGRDKNAQMFLVLMFFGYGAVWENGLWYFKWKLEWQNGKFYCAKLIYKFSCLKLPASLIDLDKM